MGPFSGWSWAGPSHTGPAAVVNSNAATQQVGRRRGAATAAAAASQAMPVLWTLSLGGERPNDRCAEALLV